MLSLEAAILQIIKYTKYLAPKSYHTEAALYMVLAEDIYAPMDLPPFDQSAMDGYALRVEEWEVGNRFIDQRQMKAGQLQEIELLPKEVIRIYTGAPLAKGANAVLIQENTSITDQQSKEKCIDFMPQVGANIRYRGSDIKQGQRIFTQGHQLSPADLGLLTALGISHVISYQQPKIAMISIGDELISPFSQPLQYGQIYNSNMIALKNQLKDIGITQIDCFHLKDDYETLYQKLTSIGDADYDLILTIAGASVGDFDFMHRIMHELCGSEVFFAKVAIQPGKPLHFGKINQALILALPGNPISAMVACECFVMPILLKMQGHQKIFKIPQAAYCIDPLPSTKQRALFLRGKAYPFYPFSSPADFPDKFNPLIQSIKQGQIPHRSYLIDVDRNQSSGALSSLADGNALLYLPANQSRVPKLPYHQVEILVLGKAFDLNSCFLF
jgi:molybdopterin molybdotransferase